MDTARALRRPTGLLALALAATTAVSVAAPVGAATPSVTADAVTVVVSATAGGVEAAAAAVRAAGGTVLHRLPLVGGVSAELPAGATLAPTLRVTENAPMTLTGKKGGGDADRSPTAIREALGLGPAASQGRGVTVAVLDTGVADVPDLAGRLTHVDVTGSWEPGEPRDGFGHGTFVAGAIAGDGRSSQGRYAGVAPGAEVLDVRVADDDGATSLVDVLAGLEAVVANGGVDVVNLSMSSGSPLPFQLDPLTVALEALWAKGITVVVPSGNEGSKTGTVTSPGSDPVLLTVGALDERLTADRRDDVVPAFSGRGPAPQDVDKPDLVAPGQSLVSLAAPGSDAARSNPDAAVGAGYFRGSGTSFSTALVSGTVAVLQERYGKVRPDQAKALLTGTAYDAKGLKDARAAGAGGLDVSAALQAGLPDVPDAVVDAPPPGDEQAWEDFIAAVEAGDRKAAANSWSRISPAGHRWAANSWSGSRWAGRDWAGDRWAGHRWAGQDGTANEWQMRIWAGHRWAGSRWAGSRWAGHRWAGSRWAEEDWAGSRWAGSRWAASRWAAAWE